MMKHPKGDVVEPCPLCPRKQRMIDAVQKQLAEVQSELLDSQRQVHQVQHELGVAQSTHAEQLQASSLETSAARTERNSAQGRVRDLELEITRLTAELAVAVPRTQAETAIAERDAAINALE